MTALEEITQAIETLERLKAASTPGPWQYYSTSTGIRGSQRYSWVVVEDNGDRFRVVEKSNFGVDVDIDLIVTLHRTIDAQLAILRATHEALTVAPGWAVERAVQRALALARAVNGATS